MKRIKCSTPLLPAASLHQLPTTNQRSRPANPPATWLPTLDLLLMDDQSLKTHLEHSVDVPPIPDRLLSPTRLPSTSSSARQSPISCEFRLPPPTPSGSFSRRTPRARTPHNNIAKESVGLNSPSANKVPPVPPRKDLLADQSRKLKMDCTPPTSEPDAFHKDTVVSSGGNWIKFDNKSSLDDTPKIG
uniref:Uncharacterized protein n=1 Tax=Ciona savignyi TaxID=51511 RepID=H2Z1W2_CIOSA